MLFRSDLTSPGTPGDAAVGEAAASTTAGTVSDTRQDGAAICPVLVRARSGRVLGTFVHRDGDRVFVQSATGSQTPYPASIVTIG